MSKRSIAEKAYDRARSRSLEDMVEVYPELWKFLLDKLVEEYRTEGSPVLERFNGDMNKAYDKARNDARRQLRELRPAAWELLVSAWSEHFKAEFGWVDEARDKQRGDDGRFARSA